MAKSISLVIFVFCILVIGGTCLSINQFPYFENFENGDGGWFTGTIMPENTDQKGIYNTSLSNSSWVLGKPSKTILTSAHSGNNCWVTKLVGNYNANE